MLLNDAEPAGARRASRVLVITDAGSILLLRARDSQGHCWWLAPGGGLDFGETYEAAARRELSEETGRDLVVGPLVWTRLHRYNWNGTPQDQYERYSVARCAEEFDIKAAVPDTYVIAHRWWRLADIQASSEDFTPRLLATYLPDIVRGKYPGTPFDCGV